VEDGVKSLSEIEQDKQSHHPFVNGLPDVIDDPHQDVLRAVVPPKISLERV